MSAKASSLYKFKAFSFVKARAALPGDSRYSLFWISHVLYLYMIQCDVFCKWPVKSFDLLTRSRMWLISMLIPLCTVPHSRATHHVTTLCHLCLTVMFSCSHLLCLLCQLKSVWMRLQVVSPQHHRRGGWEPSADARRGRELPGSTEQKQPGRFHPLCQVRFRRAPRERGS